MFFKKKTRPDSRSESIINNNESVASATDHESDLLFTKELDMTLKTADSGKDFLINGRSASPNLICFKVTTSVPRIRLYIDFSDHDY